MDLKNLVEYENGTSADDYLKKCGYVTTTSHGGALMEERRSQLAYNNGSWQFNNEPPQVIITPTGSNNIAASTFIPSGTYTSAGSTDLSGITFYGQNIPKIGMGTWPKDNSLELEKLRAIAAGVETREARIEVAKKLEPYFSINWIQKNIFKLSDKEIQQITEDNKEINALKKLNDTQFHNIRVLQEAHNALKETLKGLPTTSDLEELCQNLSSQLVEANAEKDNLNDCLRQLDKKLDFMHDQWINTDNALFDRVCEVDKLNLEIKDLKNQEEFDSKFIQDDTVYIDEANVNYYIDKHIQTKQAADLESFRTNWDKMSLLEKSNYVSSGAMVWKASDGKGPFRTIREINVAAGNQREFGIVCRNKKGKDIQVPISDLLPYNPNKKSTFKSTVFPILSGAMFAGLAFTVNPILAVVVLVVQFILMSSTMKEIKKNSL